MDFQEFEEIALETVRSGRDKELISKLFGENDEPNKSFRAAFAVLLERMRRYYEGGQENTKEERYIVIRVWEIVIEMPKSLKRGYSDEEVAIILSVYAKNVCKKK